MNDELPPAKVRLTDGLGAVFGDGPWHVEQRTNACSDVCDKHGKVVATCSWSANAKQRADALCSLLNAAADLQTAPRAGVPAVHERTDDG